MLNFLNKNGDNLKGAISPYDNYCDGFGSPGSSGNSYVLGFYLGVGTAHLNLRHDGSRVLDEISAFDKAEIADATLGQINMSIVSSFCGPAGIIWGYDIATHPKLRKSHELEIEPVIDFNGKEVPVYSASPLIEATKKLFGTVDNKRFPLLPGAHVPCAGKNYKDIGPRHIYSSFAIGIATDRSKNACLLMEDMGWLPLKQDSLSQKRYKKMILKNLAQSVVEIGKNQKVEYKEIFLEIADVEVNDGEVGCSLVASPYFTLAKKALPDGKVDKLYTLDLPAWEKSVQKSFLDEK